MESLAEFMGWTSKKPKQLGKADIAKEMQGSVLRGIEDKEAIPSLSNKKMKELRKVSFLWNISTFFFYSKHFCDEIFDS